MDDGRPGALSVVTPTSGSSALATIRLASPPGRWTIAAAVLGSGAVFVEGSTVTVALPAIARDFGLGVAGLQWIVNSYLLSLSALILLGGSLGDVFPRRRVFVAGLLAFAATSALCATASGLWALVGVRFLQGAAGALLVPNSLALLDTGFAAEDRGAAIGRWAGWSAISTAAGPLLGGWLVDATSWRWVFASVTPLALAAVWIALRYIPGARRPPDVGGSPTRPGIDVTGAALVTLGLAGVVGALIAGPEVGATHPAVLGAGAGGVALLAAFVAAERRTPDPLLPLDIFRSRQFTGTNVATLLLYAALNGVFLLLVLELEAVLGYSALAAGASLLPVNVLMLVLSPGAGRVAQRIGPRLPMTFGALVMGAGTLLLARVHPGVSYAATVLPALLVLGVGLALVVGPLTAAVLGAVDARRAGIASAVNNAAARLAGLLATTALPLAAGLAGVEQLASAAFTAGFARAMRICAALCTVGALVEWLTVRRGAPHAISLHPSPSHGCVPRGARRAPLRRDPLQ